LSTAVTQRAVDIAEGYFYPQRRHLYEIDMEMHVA